MLNQDFCEFLKALLVVFSKAAQFGAVDIKDADHFTVFDQRNNDF